MIRWIPYTFVRTVACFIAGILLAITFPHTPPLPYAVALEIVLVIAYVVVFCLKRKDRGHVAGIIALLAVLVAGYIHVLLRNESSRADHILHKDRIQAYAVLLTGYIEEKERSWKIIGEIRRIRRDGHWAAACGKLILYFDKTRFRTPYVYGDVLVIEGRPELVQGPGNPMEFDYRAYLANRNIFHHDFIRKQQISFAGREPGNPIIQASMLARTWAHGILQLYMDGERELAVAAALVLGITDGLDHDLLQAYAGSGAMHVLAVSGLHISIIYFIIAALMKPLNRWRRGQWIIAVVSLWILWGYAFITGLSPSVLRAVAMFTFVVTGKAISRHTNIYNTLAASAFCLLLFDPLLVTSVGFQLSYLAVFGIVYIHPAIYDRWTPDSWLANEAWKVTSVSIAAQLATFPLGLLYFHQFPNYFLLANLAVIPLSFVVLVVGLLLFAVSFVPAVAWLVGKVLVAAVFCLNGSVITIERLPMSVTGNIHVTGLQTVLLLFFLVGLMLMLQFRRFVYLGISMVMIAVFACLRWNHHNRVTANARMIVYRIPGHSALDVIDRVGAFTFIDSTLLSAGTKVSFHVSPYRSAMLVNDVRSGDEHPISRKIAGGRLIALKNTIILHVTSDIFEPRPASGVRVVVISNNSVRDVGRLRAAYSDAVIVFDSSNSSPYIERMLGEGVPAHSVLHQGAFEFVI